MIRVEAVLGVIVVIAWIYSIVTCVLTPDDEVRGIPKFAWLILIILLPLLGSVLWIGVGRSRTGRVRPQRFSAPAHGAVESPRGYSAMTADERIRRLEEDLARLDDERDGDGGSRNGRG